MGGQAVIGCLKGPLIRIDFGQVAIILVLVKIIRINGKDPFPIRGREKVGRDRGCPCRERGSIQRYFSAPL